MARTKKSDTTTTTVADKKETVAKTVPAEKQATKKTTEVAVVKNEIATTEPDAVCQDTPLATEFTQVLAQVQMLAQQFSALRVSLRALEKKASRELKIANKASKKNKRAKSNRQPSGFVKPTQISAELATFLGKAKGVEMARTEVTKEINTYIRAHSLQDPKNGRRIIPDANLTSLLKLKGEDDLTYFNLQKFMSPHFAKAGAVVVAKA